MHCNKKVKLNNCHRHYVDEGKNVDWQTKLNVKRAENETRKKRKKKIAMPAYEWKSTFPIVSFFSFTGLKHPDTFFKKKKKSEVQFKKKKKRIFKE